MFTCRFCEHVNPADAKFCNACGGALHQVPCPRCGAMNDVTAAACHQCNTPLPGYNTETLDSTPPAAAVSMPLPYWYFRVIVGIAVLAAVAVLGYHAYRQHQLADALRAFAASGKASDRGKGVGAGMVSRDALAGDATPAAPPRAEPNRPGEGRQTAESRKAKPAPASVADSEAIVKGRVRETRPSRLVECTAPVAALGLCPPQSVQESDARTAAAIKKPIAVSQRTGAGNPNRQPLPPEEACAEPVAALGLCKETPTQRRK